MQGSVQGGARVRGRWGGALLALAATLAVPAAADASRVAVKEIDVGPRAQARGGTPVVVYTAGRGESNRLKMVGGFTTKVVDRNATIRAGSGCERVTKHRARCEIPQTRQRLDVTIFARAKLKGGRDRASGTGIFWSRLHGGGGNDRLRGTPSNDHMIGGPGSDVMNGGGNPSGGGDTVSYQGRTDDLRVTTSASQARNDGGARDGKPGKRDRLVNIENVVGGNGDDVLVGDEGVNHLLPLLGEDMVRALAGTDVIDLGTAPGGGGPADQQPDKANCGPDNDSVQGQDASDTFTGCENA